MTQPAIAVVDAYSTGKYFPALIQARGCRCIHVHSGVEKASADFAAFPEPPGVDAIVAHDGDVGALAKRLRAAGVVGVVAGCESGVELVDAVNVALGFPAHDPATGTARRDKFAMQEALRRAGVRGIESVRATSVDVLRSWVREHGRWPVIVKPVRSTGTQGLHVCRNEADAVAAFAAITAAPDFFGAANPAVLAQEYVAGIEYPVNMVSHQGEHYLSDFWVYRKVRRGEGVVYDYARLLPYPEDAAGLALLEYTKAALDALGVRNGPTHSEVMLTDTGPVLIETGARVMGAGISPELIADCIGHHQLELTLDAILAPATFPAKVSAPYALRRHLMIKCFIAETDVDIATLPAVHLAAGLPSVYSGNFAHALAEGRVHRTHDLFTSPGSLILCHEHEATLMADYQLLHDVEEDAQSFLYEPTPDPEAGRDPHWFEKLPDEHWLKSEEQAAADARVIGRLLDMYPGKRLLDCPCGDARVGLHLQRRGLDYVGVDINPNFVATARKRLAAAGFPADITVDDMRALTFAAEFDVVLNWFNSFGYFDFEADLEVLRRLAAALRPGGHLFIESPNRAHVLANIQGKTGPDGQPLPISWNERNEALEVTIPVERPDGTEWVHAHSRIYSLAQFRLFFRLVGLELAGAYDEDLGPVAETSKRLILVGRRPA